jgi:hypothetical protein
VARIDAPRLNYLSITFFNGILFETPQIMQSVSRTPMLGALEKARVIFDDRTAWVDFLSETFGNRLLRVGILCRELDWQLSSLEQVCTSCLLSFSSMEALYIYKCPGWQQRQDNIESTQWLELVHPFSTVKNLYLSKEFALRIAPALQELVGGRTTKVLPTLQNIFLEELQLSGPVHEGIGKFVAARQLSGHPITVSLWE